VVGVEQATPAEVGEPPSWWLYWALVAAVAAIAVVAIATQAPLSYDGSAYLFKIYDRSTAFVPFHRYTSWVEQWPAVLAAKTGNFELTRAAFSVSYAITPVALFATAAALIWRSSRTYLPMLVLGLLGSTFVAQTFYVSESMISVQLWWCAWAAFVPRERSTLRNVVGSVFAVLAIFMYVPAIALVVVLAVALWIRERRRALPWILVMAAATLVRLAVNGGLVASEESDNAPKSVGEFTGSLGHLLVAGFALLLLGLLVWQLAFGPPIVGQALAGVGLVLVLVSIAQRDYFGLSQHTALWLLALPAGIGGCVMLVLPVRTVPLVVGPVLVAVWILAVGISLASWHTFLGDFRGELADADRCAKPTAVLEAREHWSMTTLGLVLDGPDRHAVILGYGTCAAWNRGDRPLSQDEGDWQTPDGQFRVR
jgi:hypothetical protein